jgi:hypothetical protein
MDAHGVALRDTNAADIGGLAALLRAAWNRQCGDSETKWLAVAEAAALLFEPTPPALLDEERQEVDVTAVLRYAQHNRPALLETVSGRRLLILAKYIQHHDHDHRFH